MPSAEGFIGTWILDPSTCNFDLGNPPLGGRYTIAWAGQGLRVTMKWTDSSGQVVSDAFEAIPDGRAYPGTGGLVQALTMQLAADDVLDTVAYHGEEVLMITRRVLSQDRQTMTVLMSGKKADGSTWENRAVYRRAP